jgi:hypothetical protein
MRTFISDIIPRLQRFSKKLDSTSVLTNKNWVLLNDEADKKVVYIFGEKDNLLRVVENGRIRKGKWDYLGNNSIELDVDNEPLLFKHAFLDEQLLALKLDGTSEYALLVNEPYYDNFINTIQKLNLFLEDTYLRQTQRSVYSSPKQISNLTIEPDQKFDPADFPNLKVELENLKKILQEYPKQNSADIIVSFAKDHSLRSEWFSNNPQLAGDVANQEIRLTEIETLFNCSKMNITFQNDLQNYMRTELKQINNIQH